MPALLEIKGQIASEGFAAGPLWMARNEAELSYQPKDTYEADQQALLDALAQASARTAALIADAEGDAVDILEFQLAMLEDDTFSSSACDLIEAGLNADVAWREVLDAEIAGYESSEDEYFRARAVDLRDLRDRVLAALTGADMQTIPQGSIYLADDIAPSLFLSHDWTGGGIALRDGSVTGHVAMLARQRGIPAIIGLGAFESPQAATALLDGDRQSLILAPSEELISQFQLARQQFFKTRKNAEKFADKPARTADGTAIRILVNIADPAEVETIPVSHVDGVGLMRTEFLFSRATGLPGEEVQYLAYKKVLDWSAGKPVTIRTVDAGGDKPVEGFTESETNPFLGVRGIRLALKNPEIFRVQIRALLRAAVHGELKVMLPMVSVPQELDEAILLFETEAASLAGAGIAHLMPKIGIMVEVPSVAILPDRFRRAAFLSIGSNDLTQYVLAAARDNGQLAYLAKADDPAVLALIGTVADYGARQDVDVSLCGDAGSDTSVIEKLLATGLTSLSVAASRIGLVKSAIAQIDLRNRL
tara:strand:- start:516 stop:2120 length:1605 start_codon:yes stop_codon:yes gene_type:complete